MSVEKTNGGKNWWLKYGELTAAGLSVSVALVALIWSLTIAGTEREIDRVDARIANCTAVAATYLEMAKTYGWPKFDRQGRYVQTKLDKNNETYAHTALRIGRAAQLCRTNKEQSLFSCIEMNVDSVEAHFVTEDADQGGSTTNAVC